jgi:hypothetical protein
VYVFERVFWLQSEGGALTTTTLTQQKKACLLCFKESDCFAAVQAGCTKQSTHLSLAKQCLFFFATSLLRHSTANSREEGLCAWYKRSRFLWFRTMRQPRENTGCIISMQCFIVAVQESLLQSRRRRRGRRRQWMDGQCPSYRDTETKRVQASNTRLNYLKVAVETVHVFFKTNTQNICNTLPG